MLGWSGKFWKNGRIKLRRDSRGWLLGNLHESAALNLNESGMKFA